MVVRVEEVLAVVEQEVVVQEAAELAVGWVGVVSQVAGLAGLVERAVQVVAERVVAQEVVAEWAGRVVA